MVEEVVFPNGREGRRLAQTYVVSGGSKWQSGQQVSSGEAGNLHSGINHSVLNNWTPVQILTITYYEAGN